MPPSVRNLFLGIQLTIILISTLLLTSGTHGDFDLKKVETFGGTLTLVMLFAGAWCHKQASNGILVLPPLLLIAGIPPVYTWMGGEIRHVITYHAVVLGVYGFVWWNLEKVRKATLAKASAQPDQAPETDPES